jgi:hypothetical protein
LEIEVIWLLLAIVALLNTMLLALGWAALLAIR